MNIVVLCGGISSEREVSIKTGTNVCEALRTKGHNAIIIDVYCGDKDIDMSNPFKEDYNVSENVEKIISYNDKLDMIAKEKKQNRLSFFGDNVLELCKMSDIVFMALHGEHGENGSVQAVFDLYDIKYTGTGPLGSAMAMDKGITKDILKVNNVSTPKGVKVTRGESVKLEDYDLKIPCVVKPCCGGSSVGVSLVFDEADYMSAIDEAYKYEDEILIEEYVKGREFSIGVIAGKALPIIEIIPKQGFYDYKNKYQAGMTEEICPAKLSDEVTAHMLEQAVRAARALKLGSYSRIDFLMDENENVYCLEANTLPGMTETSLLPQEAAAIGYTFPELCEWLIKESEKRFA